MRTPLPVPWRVTILTLALTAVVVPLAVALFSAQAWAWGLGPSGGPTGGTIDFGTANAFAAVCAAVLAPTFLGPLVWLSIRFRELSRRLREAAYTDALTGVPNRRAFFERVGGSMGGPAGAPEPPRPVSLLVIDVDRFKALNDRLGHEAGDAALCHVAREVARGLARSGVAGAMLARLGGEEFAVALDGAGPSEAGPVAEAICAHLRATPFRHGGEAVPVTVSVGLWSGTTSCGADGALAAADRAAYAAKANGRDRWEVAGEAVGGGDHPGGAGPLAA